MNLTVPGITPGDKIAIVAPAKSIEAEHVLYARDFLQKKGFEVQLGKHCLGAHHYFSGTLTERLEDFQTALDDPEIKAILCARGGYGCVQLVDNLQWAAMLRSPKWIIGYSDITVFHSRLHMLGIKSIHGTVPLNFQKNTDAALTTLLAALTNTSYTIECGTNSFNKTGIAEGMLVGGNLSILYSLLGTNDQLDYSGTILFIEDLAEQLYSLDRMFYALSKAGVLDKIRGLIVGGMTDMKDTAVSFGQSIEEIILSHFHYRKIPIAFDFPAGHIDDNRALRLGETVILDVNSSSTTLSFSS